MHITYMSDRDQNRTELASTIRNAADAHTALTTARAALTAAWETLYTTPAELFHGRTLALMNAQEAAREAARTWDVIARTLATYHLHDEETGRITTWETLARTMDVDTSSWAVCPPRAYPVVFGPGAVAPGPEERKEEATARSQQHTLENLFRLLGTPTPTPVVTAPAADEAA